MDDDFHTFCRGQIQISERDHMSKRMNALSLADTFLVAKRGLSGLGIWANNWSFWTFFTVAALLVVAKSGFKWAGQTGYGWFIEFNDVIETWPLKEPLALTQPVWTLYQENYSSIALFRAFDAIGFPHSSFTWNFIHILATLIAVLYLGIWARRTYGDGLGKFVALTLLFGAAPMVLLHEIGRYDSLFFLGAVLLATGLRWWSILIGAILLSTSSWTMGVTLAISLLLVGFAIRSKSLLIRGAIGFASCGMAVIVLMLARLIQGGDPWVGRLGAFSPGGSTNGINTYYLVWWNVVQPFPNWIYAALGLTWILFLLVILQSTRRRLILVAAILGFTVVAASLNTGDGTRDLALTLTATLIAVASILEKRTAIDGTSNSQLNLNPAVLGAIMVVCIVAPVVNIYPHEPLNPYGWLGMYGLSILDGFLQK